MLGVHRHDLARRSGAGDQGAASHQRLLVRQSQHRAAAQGGQRRRQAPGPGHAVEHHVGGLGRDQLGHRFGTGQDPWHPVVAAVVAAPLRLGEYRQLQVLHSPGEGDRDGGCASVFPT